MNRKIEKYKEAVGRNIQAVQRTIERPYGSCGFTEVCGEYFKDRTKESIEYHSTSQPYWIAPLLKPILPTLRQKLGIKNKDSQFDEQIAELVILYLKARIDRPEEFEEEKIDNEKIAKISLVLHSLAFNNIAGL